MPAPPFQNILVPTDFSDLSALALRYAAAIARCSRAKLTLLHANTFSPPAYFTETYVKELERQFRASFAEAEKGLDKFAAATVGSAAGLEKRVEEGLPADAIVRYASAEGIDLVAMGTHGRSGFNRWTLGSVTERVLRASSVPVLTVRPSSVPAAGPVAIRHILCPVNNSLPARRALRVATALAACFGARVTAVHVKGGQASDWIPDLCAWLAENKSGDCETRETIRQGDPATEIVSATAEIDCDLAVIGARHRAFFDSTVLGATTVRVVRHARCPVLTVVGQETQPQ